ncbi:MAG: TetR/AcrR family transcriptional regulator [Gammaproteobacteria bacterium]
MSGKQEGTRERILSVAETIILQRGFSATSIDDILQNAAITKGGFFYHFNGKKELARALVERYLDEDDRIFAGLFAQADAQSDDPLQQVLLFLEQFADMMRTLQDTHPGCLVASFTYESQQLDGDVHELVKQGVLIWRKLLLARLEKVAALYSPCAPISLTAVADMFTSSVEGGIILSRILQSNEPLADQIMLYRQYLQLLFQPQWPSQP